MRGLLLSLCCMLTVARGPARAETVSVTFAQPESHTGAAPNGGVDTPGETQAVSEIGNYLQALGARYLSPRQSLNIRVQNIVLAGRFEPWRGPGYYDVRILRDIYPPRITLRYQLTEGTRTLAEGDETISDVNYLANPRAKLTRDPLRYEKAMLSDWFEARFGARKPVSGG